MGDYNAHFSRHEFACKDGCGMDDVDGILAAGLLGIREMVGMAVVLTSANRCQRHNAKVGGSIGSQHLLMLAADIWSKAPLLDLYEAALLQPQFRRGGLGLYVSENRLHVDCRQTGKARWLVP